MLLRNTESRSERKASSGTPKRGEAGIRYTSGYKAYALSWHFTHTHCKGEYYCSKPMEEARSSHSEKGGAADGGEGACTAGEGRGMDTAPLVINK